ncbi:MAG: hypothetical protein NZ560_07040, partial [Aquificaceae bacterium]|nr:hypothetical protein [Aquificaceae bacterium]
MKKVWLLPVLLLMMLLPASHRPSHSQSISMSNYCYVPPFTGINVPPNVMIMLSIDTSMQGAAHPDVTCSGDPRTSYSCNPASCRYNTNTADSKAISNCYNNSREYY